jgi:trehalose 6-phosphate synthase
VSARRKLIVVSNRGPVTFSRASDGLRTARRGGGGLVTALGTLASQHEVTWIASAMTEEDRAVAAEAGGGAFEEQTRDGSPFRLRLVTHDPEAYDRYYNVVANPTLWFLQHSLWGLATEPDVDAALYAAWTDGYEAVNRAFADAVCAELERDPDAAVFFHDYHLYLAPRMVRERVPGAALAHFVHIPWPEPDAWRVLPDPLRRAVHEGLLANDVVGLHTARWRDNFLQSCDELLDADVDRETGDVQIGGRTCLTRFHPASVDPGDFDALAGSEAVLTAEEALVAERPEFLVLRVDRTDPSKNVVRGFKAFARYLELHPEMHGRVAMLALLDPSRQDIPAYVDYLAAIEREAEAVNTRFAREGWRPLVVHIEDDFPGAVAAYKQFDVLLVNAIVDGLNLIAKEAPLVNTRDGVLVLSENTGAHEELHPWALTVNPFDLEGQAAAIHEGLTMPVEERRRNLEGIRDHVRRHDVAAWIDAQLRDLDEARNRLSP